MAAGSPADALSVPLVDVVRIARALIPGRSRRADPLIGRSTGRLTHVTPMAGKTFKRYEETVPLLHSAPISESGRYIVVLARSRSGSSGRTTVSSRPRGIRYAFHIDQQ